jgi:cation transport protein ChaC
MNPGELDHDDLWVFGYGSLMWRPGFAFTERQPALLRGAHRSLCVYSWHHRGTAAAPGLVLGLKHGGSCRGVAFRVPAAARAETLAYLTEREQQNYVYRESYPTLRLADGRTVTGLTYLMDQRHAQFAQGLTPEQQLVFVRQGHGISGSCADYVRNTYAHLQRSGIEDAGLAWIVANL